MLIKSLGLCNLVLSIGSAIVFSGCSVYTSADRKKFEVDNPQLTTLLSSSETLLENNCSTESVSSISQNSKVISTMTNPQEEGPLLVWQHQIGNHLVYESENLKGVFCVIND